MSHWHELLVDRQRLESDCCLMNSKLAIALFVASISTLAHGETFIGPTTSTNRLLVPSNSAIVITATLGDFTNSTQVILNDPIGISIGTNQTMRLFGVPAPVNASFSRPGTGFVDFTLEPNRPAEISGPGTLALNSGVFFPYAKFISYFIAEDGFAMPNQRFIAGPSGSFAISVEKTVDLNTWSPVLLQNTSDDNRAFYRLRIQR